MCPGRHNTNPVGMEWRWKMDPPEKILLEAMENHQNMIRQFKGQCAHHVCANTCSYTHTHTHIPFNSVINHPHSCGIHLHPDVSVLNSLSTSSFYHLLPSLMGHLSFGIGTSLMNDIIIELTVKCCQSVFFFLIV